MHPFLIADDSPDKTMMLTMMLRHSHWDGEIFHAPTTEEATALIDAHPDIAHAFIDYYMPSQNGPAVIAYLKKKNPAAHIALVSSSDNKENCDEALGTGAETCICTSYTSDEVERSILGLLAQWQEQNT